VTPALTNYHFAPLNRSFSVVANVTDAVFTGSPDALPTGNAIDTSEYFVRQQYLDFLGREPDAPGFTYWVGQLQQCGTDATCLRDRRLDVAAAFFASDEFQQTGSYIYRLYQGGLGRQLSYAEFTADHGQVLGGATLAASQATFADAFVQRAEFTTRYQSNVSADSFVNAILQTVRDTTGTDLSGQRDALITAYNSGGAMNESRSRVMQAVANDAGLAAGVYNRGFVLMEYYGFLHREVDDAGYQFWLAVLNQGDRDNYRGMVCAFVSSAEYQKRFGVVVTQSNANCAGVR